MMSCIYPHEMFESDFLKMFQEVQRQESIDTYHEDESTNGMELFYFFAECVFPLIKTDDWVYNGALKFATEFADDYFVRLRLMSSVKEVQEQQEIVRNNVKNFLKKAINLNLAPTSIKLTKLSDFILHVNVSNLPQNMQKQASILYDKANDLELLYVNSASQALQAMYEKGLPRVFYVVKRALKVEMDFKQTSGDNILQDPDQYFNWCKQKLMSDHILSRLFVENSNFYNVARNVDSHKMGPKWLPETNEIYLREKNEQKSLKVNITDFSRRYRYLMYFCEIGARGILASFCERERGNVANKVKDRYLKIYDNPKLESLISDYSV